VKETGVLMIDEMRDKAIADLKTQTRRVIMPQPSVLALGVLESAYSADRKDWQFYTTMHGDIQEAVSPWIKCPYGRQGDRLYLKEDVCLTKKRIGGKLCIIANYRFGYEDTGFRQYKWENLDKATRRKLSKKKTWGRWTSKLLMYKFLARVWFDITGVKVERLQEISEKDSMAEGIQAFQVGYPRSTGEPFEGYVTEYGVTNWIPSNEPTAIRAYRRLWDSVNADRGYGWDKNPWVWAITFKRLRDIL